jgi:hypothetical protein
MTRRRLQAVERRLLAFLWIVTVGVAAAGIAVLVGDLYAGDWRYGTVAQLAGVALSVSSTSFLLWTTHRVVRSTQERDDINRYNAASIIEIDRMAAIAADEIERMEARLDQQLGGRVGRGAGISGTKTDDSPGAEAPDHPAPHAHSTPSG